MAKQKDYSEFHYFAYIANNPAFGFSTYRDAETGMPTGYVIGYDKLGRPEYKFWQFNYDSQRIKRVGVNEKDKENKSAYEFLKNSPACMGSGNGSYINGAQTGYFYKEIDNAKEAKEAVDTRRESIEAQSKALGLEVQLLTDIAAIIGVFDDSEEIKRHRVLDFASNEPKKFLGILKDNSLKIKSLIKKGISSGVLKLNGRVVEWNGTVIGSDEDEAVARLLKEEKMRVGIETHLSKLK